MNLINAKYRLYDDEIDFLIFVISNNYVALKDKKYDLKFIKKFMSKVLEISTNDGYIYLNWLSYVEYDTYGMVSVVRLQADIELFLTELSMELSSKDLKYFFSLSNNYSRAIYKLLKIHQHKSYANVNLEDLKKRLQVPKGLTVYSNFKIKVLNVAQQEISENTDLNFEIQEKKLGKKVISIYFDIKTNLLSDRVKKIENKNIPKENFIKESKKNKIQNLAVASTDDTEDDIKRIVSFFDFERKKLQPNYVRKEASYNTSGEYLLRVHLAETGRTPQMFFDAIRWLFSNNPKASFHRQYIMNIGKLIEHFNTLEHQAMYSQEAVQFNEEAKAWYNIYKKQGLSHEEILEKLKEGEYIR